MIVNLSGPETENGISDYSYFLNIFIFIISSRIQFKIKNLKMATLK